MRPFEPSVRPIERVMKGGAAGPSFGGAALLMRMDDWVDGLGRPCARKDRERTAPARAAQPLQSALAPRRGGGGRGRRAATHRPHGRGHPVGREGCQRRMRAGAKPSTTVRLHRTNSLLHLRRRRRCGAGRRPRPAAVMLPPRGSSLPPLAVGEEPPQGGRTGPSICSRERIEIHLLMSWIGAANDGAALGPDAQVPSR